MFKLLYLAAIINTNKAEEPFHPDSGDHIDFLEHKFYDLYFFNNATLAEGISLIKNPNATIHQNLSNSDDVPEIRINLNWDFKFYGHLHNWISISPNGFLTTHPTTCWSFCNWWYEEQNYRRYIAPMMADFNPSRYDDSHILYYINDHEESLSVEWHNVTLYQPSSADPLGYKYDFQVKIKSDGTIYFYYFNVPKAPNTLQVPEYFDQNYSLHIGLEDAAYKHDADGLYYIRPYSPVEIDISHALHRHAVVFKPKETCIDETSCIECQTLATDPGSSLECGWCPELALCSDGMGREIYEYISHEYCTEDEMLDNLVSEICTDYVTETRICKENDHVLARYPPEMIQDGNSRYYSGVIMAFNDDSNTYTIHYDDSSISESMVQYSFVHSCSAVSYDYSSYDLPPRCVPHCASSLVIANDIDTEISNNETQISNHTVRTRNKGNSKTEAVITSISIAVAILIVICACVQLFMYRGRQRHRFDAERRQSNIAMESTIIDEDDSLKFPSALTPGFGSDDMNDRHMSADEENMNRVTHPIISPAPNYTYGSKLRSPNMESRSSVEVSDVEIEDVGEVQLQSENIKSSLNTNNKGWDMTPLS